MADTENLRQTFSYFAQLTQALLKIVPPLEQRENNKMPLKGRLQREISEHKSLKSSKSSKSSMKKCCCLQCNNGLSRLY